MVIGSESASSIWKVVGVRVEGAELVVRLFRLGN